MILFKKTMCSSNNMLEISSCLFATIVLHGFYLKCVVYHHIFLALTVTSILFHCQHHPVVKAIDKFLAHLAFVLVLLDTPKVIETKNEWLLLFPIMSVCSWFGQSVWPEKSEIMHLALHLIAVYGMHMYLYVLYWEYSCYRDSYINYRRVDSDVVKAFISETVGAKYIRMATISWKEPFLFATVVLHAFYRQSGGYHHTFLLMSFLAVASQITQNRFLKIIDGLANKTTFIIIITEIPRANALGFQWLAWFPLCIICVDITQYLLPGRRLSLCVFRTWILLLSAHVAMCLLH